jgi:septal ring factor EnvC (AmiA/AmiB activator)
MHKIYEKLFKIWLLSLHFAFCILYFAFCLSPALAANAPDRTAEEVRTSLERIKREAEENRKRLSRTEARERSVVAQMDSLDREMGLARSYFKQLDAEAQRLTQEMRGADTALDVTARRLVDRQAGFARRLRDVYKQGRRLQGLQALLSADSFTGLLRRSRYLAAVARQDREDYAAILRDRDAIGATRARLSAQQEAFEAVRREREAQVKALSAQVETRRRLLGEVRRNVKTYRAAEAQFARDRERSEEALRRLIAEAEEGRARRQEARGPASAPQADAFSGGRGRLRWPVRGPVVGRFGRIQDPALKTWTFNRGVEIETPEGTPVQAVAAGQVETVDWFRGYGWFALVGHGGGYYTLYAHLSEVSVRVGDRVEAGEPIALSGSTGTLDQRPTLHFEILKGSDPEDPMAWLGR